MRIALLADVHGNLPALEAVMEGIRRHKPDRIISLGDQVNLGPSPKEVLSLLRAENVECISGNHERYILSAMAGDPTYQAANFSAPRFAAGTRASANSFLRLLVQPRPGSRRLSPGFLDLMVILPQGFVI